MALRTTPEERELIDRAVVATGTDLTDFVVSHAYQTAQRVLADHDRFELDACANIATARPNGRSRTLAALVAADLRGRRGVPGCRTVHEPTAAASLKRASGRLLLKPKTTSDLPDYGAPPRIRTENLRIKSPLLCR